MIVEILNEDGTMARRPDLEKFGEKHGIKLGTIADLIEYRNNNETTIERVASCKLPTEFGEFDLITYRDTIDNQVHYALCKGEVSNQPTLVRVHLQDTFTDLLHSDRSAERSWTLTDAMRRINAEGGVLVILGKEESSESIIHKVRNFEAQDNGENRLLPSGRVPAVAWVWGRKSLPIWALQKCAFCPPPINAITPFPVSA